MPGVVSCGYIGFSAVVTKHLPDFPHEHARSRAFRWGEDGIAGVSDTHGFQNIAFAFWNEEESKISILWSSTGFANAYAATFSRNGCLVYQIPKAIMVRVSRRHIFIWIILQPLAYHHPKVLSNN
jgi:hypothetical protein